VEVVEFWPSVVVLGVMLNSFFAGTARRDRDARWLRMIEDCEWWLWMMAVIVSDDREITEWWLWMIDDRLMTVNDAVNDDCEWRLCWWQRMATENDDGDDDCDSSK
jgi:hypothetical protein